MHPFHQPPVVRLRIAAPGGEAPRGHPKQPHPPSVVAAVRHLVETTRLPHRIIAERTRVDKGTISRWSAKFGWQRPPGAWPRAPRPEGRRYQLVIRGPALATRLRMQCERLLAEIENAETVDPAALAEAIALLERARAEQKVRRGKRVPPPPPSEAELAAKAEARAKRKLDPVTREHIRETRRKAARKAWATRWANQDKPPAWMRQADADEAAYRKARRERRLGRDLPSPHLPHVTKPERVPYKWDRRAAALQGWKRRYARMREAGLTEKKDK
jgi:hypothetical protein